MTNACPCQRSHKSFPCESLIAQRRATTTTTTTMVVVVVALIRRLLYWVSAVWKHPCMLSLVSLTNDIAGIPREQFFLVASSPKQDPNVSNSGVWLPISVLYSEVTIGLSGTVVELYAIQVSKPQPETAATRKSSGILSRLWGEGRGGVRRVMLPQKSGPKFT